MNITTWQRKTKLGVQDSLQLVSGKEHATAGSRAW